MTKNLKLNAIGIFIFSAILSLIPIGAVFASNQAATEVMAKEVNAKEVNAKEVNTKEVNAKETAGDTTKPTLNAAVSNGLLTITGYDSDSGIKAFYVNGYEFTDFTDNTLTVRLQQFDSGYEYFTIQVMDNAGNMSESYKTKNPYYDEDTMDDDDNGASTLPVNASASKPSSATATVIEHTVTASKVSATLENAESEGTQSVSTQEAEKRASMAEADAVEEAESAKSTDENSESESGKEFYTIQTESEKVFYLIIDRDGDEETVYFLTEIDENDLLNTISSTSETLPKNSAAVESAIPTSEDALSNNNTGSEVAESEAESEEEISEEEKEESEEDTEDEIAVENSANQGSAFSYIFMGIIGAAVIGIWYYLKMVKGKKENFLDEDDEEDEEEDIVYESDDEAEGGGEDDFFKMDEEEESDFLENPVENPEEDVADTIDEE